MRCVILLPSLHFRRAVYVRIEATFEATFSCHNVGLCFVAHGGYTAAAGASPGSATFCTLLIGESKIVPPQQEVWHISILSSGTATAPPITLDLRHPQY